MKKILVLGSTGQDGSYACEILAKKKNKVYGLVRKSSTDNKKNLKKLIKNKKYFNKNFFLVRGDLNDYVSIRNIISKIKPDEIYNFADQDHVSWSFDIPIYSFTTTAQSVINILETIKSSKRKIKYFQPLSSNIFGKSKSNKQNEKTNFNPQSIYAVSKVSVYYICKMYREIFGIKVYGAIFYNHESPKRSEDYVTKKIVKHACEIKKGVRNKIELGDINAKIDWGYAKEYVENSIKIMQLSKPDFFVIGSGKAKSVKTFLIKTFSELGLDFRKYLKINKKFIRPSKTSTLIGDSTKAKKTFGFKIKNDLNKIIQIMLKEELKNYD